MNKKANWIGVGLLIVGILGITMLGLYLTGVLTPQATVQQTTQTAQQVAQATKTGDVSSLGVYVRDISNNNINTKVAVPVYCQDDAGSFIIDGTSSSTTAEITGKTEIGRTVTCWAFNSTYQSEPVTVKIDGESPHIVIDSYKVPTSAKLQFYDDTYTTGTGGAINMSAGADATDTFQKMKFTNNNSDTMLPLGGFYFDIIESSNVSALDISGSASLSGMDKATTQIVESDLSTKVSARKTLWDFVFEIDDDSSQSGNQALLMEENDYLETGSVSVTADGDGCSGSADLISSYAFTKGYYRSNKEDSVKYGHETDATTSAVITSDITGETFYCTA